MLKRPFSTRLTLLAPFFALCLAPWLAPPARAQGNAWPDRSCDLAADSPAVAHLACRFRLPDPPVGAPEVRNGDGRSEIDFLVLEGTLEDTAREHGRLLARKIASGVTRFVSRSKSHLLQGLPPMERNLYRTLLGCFVSNHRASASPEFIALHKAMAEGMREAGVTEYDEADLFEMSYGSELTALIGTLRRQLERDPFAAIASLTAKCGIAPLLRPLQSLFARQALYSPHVLPYIGCTGAAASGSGTKSGGLVMARNVDSSALGYVERNPLVILHKPPNGHAYVGVATPGMHYSGGSSGFNDEGLAVTLHAIGTDDVRSRFVFKEGMTAFYLQDRVLARASSIDEAFALVREVGRQSGWAMVVGDVKTGEIASIEWTAGKAVIARRVKDGNLVQTNQFLAPEMKPLYVPSSFNKMLESRARQTRVEALLARDHGRIDARSMMALLGDDVDAFEGRRSFGRNVTKAITTYSHVMEPTQGGKGRFTLTLGDRLPVTRGRTLSFDVDFSAARAGRFPFRVDAPRDAHAPTLTPEGMRSAAWSASRGAYTQAYMVHRDGDDGTLPIVEALLTNASALARRAGRVDFPYDYMKARVALRMASSQNDGTRSGELAAAAALARASSGFALLRARLEKPASKLHPYDISLVRLWSARARQMELLAQGADAGAALADAAVQANLREALAIHETLLLSEPGDENLRMLMGSYRDARRGKFVAFDAVASGKAGMDFVTVE